MNTRRHDSQRQSPWPLSGSSPHGRISSSPQKGQKKGTARAVGSTCPSNTGAHARSVRGHSAGMTRRPALAALFAAVALLASGCSDNQSGDSVTDNQQRTSPPSASPS